MTEELKPCPMCGGPLSIESEYGSPNWFARCNHCTTTFKGVACETREAAVRFYGNTRATDPDAEALADAVEKAVPYFDATVMGLTKKGRAIAQEVRQALATFRTNQGEAND